MAHALSLTPEGELTLTFSMKIWVDDCYTAYPSATHSWTVLLNFEVKFSVCSCTHDDDRKMRRDLLEMSNVICVTFYTCITFTLWFVLCSRFVLWKYELPSRVDEDGASEELLVDDQDYYPESGAAEVYWCIIIEHSYILQIRCRLLNKAYLPTWFCQKWFELLPWIPSVKSSNLHHAWHDFFP